MFIISLFFLYVLYLVFIVSSPLENNITSQNPDNQSTFKAIAAFFTLCIVYLVYYLLFIVEKPKLLGKASNPLLDFLQQRCPITSREYYRPTFWCYGSRLQTGLRVAVFRDAPQVDYRMEPMKLPDGGEIMLHWLDNARSRRFPVDATRPTVLLMPGTTGCQAVSYMLHLVKMTEIAGCRAVVVNWRGNGGGELLTPKAYCGLSLEDIEATIAYVRRKLPDAPLLAAGNSLGGMILSHVLAKRGAESELFAAALFSVPWNFAESQRMLEEPINKLLFNRHFVHDLHVYYLKHRRMLEQYFNIDEVLATKSIREYDELVTRRMFGFNSVDEYYSTAKLVDKVHQIRTPVFALHADDDPIAPGWTVPLKQIAQSDFVAMLMTSYGGHLAWIDGLLPVSVGNFMDRAYGQWLEAVVSDLHEVCDLRERMGLARVPNGFRAAVLDELYPRASHTAATASPAPSPSPSPQQQPGVHSQAHQVLANSPNVQANQTRVSS